MGVEGVHLLVQEIFDISWIQWEELLEEYGVVEYGPVQFLIHMGEEGIDP